MSFFNGIKMDTGIWYLVIDPIDDVVLTAVRDYRIAQAVSVGFLDSKIESLSDYSMIHKDAVAWCRANFTKFETSNVRIGNPVAIVPDEQLSSGFAQKKSLAIARKRMLMLLYMVADITNYSLFYDNFMNHEAFTVMSSALTDPSMMKEYASCLGISVEEAEKEIKLKIDSRKYTVVKLQGHVDKLTKEINALTDPAEVMAMAPQISYRIAGVVRS